MPEQIWRKPDSERKSNAGRRPMDAVLMFKILVLGAIYNLSDYRHEYQVRDRLSFMSCPAGPLGRGLPLQTMRGRFLGLGLGDRVPDAKTVWLYREALAQAGKVADLFKLFDHCPAVDWNNRREGIVPVPRNHNTREENAAIKYGKEPEGSGQSGGGQVADARQHRFRGLGGCGLAIRRD